MSKIFKYGLWIGLFLFIMVNDTVKGDLLFIAAILITAHWEKL